MKIITDPRCTQYHHPGHPERPERIRLTEAKLRQQSQLPLTWAKPVRVTDDPILRAHSTRHLERLRQPCDFDADTPAFARLLEHARHSVGGALAALETARQGEMAFSLMRPPGHHATREQAMGFCYLNNIAIAALEARASGTAKVAVFDFDVHHANGTESILLHQPGCAVYSIHQYPAYPGTGVRSIGNSYNYPVPPHTPRQDYRAILGQALQALQKFHPTLVAVSAGFDAYGGDPLADGRLELEDYHWLGQSLRALNVPTFSLLEGGYSDDLPELVLAYLCGLAGK